MAAGRIVLSQYFPARDRSARLVAGAQMFVYLNGTTTKASIYSDQGLLVPLANPVEANSSGQFPAIWASDAATYTLSITSADGSSIGNPSVFDDYSVSTNAATASVALAEAASVSAEADAVAVAAAYADILAVVASGSDAAAIAARAAKSANGSDFATPLNGTGGSALVGYLQAGTGASAITAQAKLRLGPISTTEWGITADSNGTTGNGTDWTTQLQSLVTYARTNGRNIWVPAKPGFFIRFTATINFEGAQTKTEVIGESQFDSAFFADFTSATAVAAFSNNATLPVRAYVSWRNFRLQGRLGDSVANKVCGIYSNLGGEFSRFEDVLVYGFYDCFVVATDFYVRFDRCLAWYARRDGYRIGYTLAGVQASCNNLSFNACHATHCGDNGLYAYSVRALTINGGAYEANSGANVFLDAAYGAGLAGVYMEYAMTEAGNPTSQLHFRNCSGCTVNGLSVSAFDNAGNPVIYVEDSTNILLNGLAIEQSGADLSAVGVLLSGSAGVQVSGFFDGMTTGVRLTNSSRVTITNSNILAATPVSTDATGNVITWRGAIDAQVTASVASINAVVATDIIRTTLAKNLIDNTKVFHVAATRATLASAGTVKIIDAELLSESYRISEIAIEVNEAFAGGGGDRGLAVRTAATVYSVIPSASLTVNGTRGRWNDTAVPYGAADTFVNATAANADLYLQYSGGATDYATTGSIVVRVIATRIA